ncbi:Amylosucrase [Nostocoides japonicum T1-X7]|uniref:Amylosucrase n=1 Tax=Nostocoides japonicum T1-X7 TaxID=1194083 RepID=A0A077LTB0_9MICO|nr:alpha-amylase family protein [Tetrasphaera japonica]CCH76366.1 Amylosucrase [Tetrasphaera japonica T1-X7]
MHLAPPSAHDAAVPALDALTTDRRRDFGLRLDRWWEDLVASLEELYGDRAEALATQLVTRAAAAYAERDEALHALDARRLLRPDWLQQPDMVGYACYAERFAGTLAEVGARAGYLRELGVTYLHLMPLLRPRDGDNDGGYAVADYRMVRPDLGTTEDLRSLTEVLRGQGISLVVDLVLNHVAREHEWARRAAAGERRYRDYFHIHPDRTEPDEYEQTLPEVFPDFAPGNFTWDDEVGGWVWTTFNAWQWDLDWSNPDVLLEFADIVLFLAGLGVEVLRLDAVAFMWKRKGTNCQNQPEVHAITQALRAVARIAAPALAFKAEAIVGPRDLVPYLGTGAHAGRVSDLAYHNSLMVQAWNVLATGDARLARHALAHLPPTPPTGTWITYLRCHDDIGWAIDDGDAAAVGLDGWLHRRFLADWYAGDLDGSWGDGLLFQVNPVTGDKRTSGTAASLAGALADRGQEESGKGLARLFVGYALVYGWGGIPVVWSGDELAMPNDPDWAAEPGHEADNRWAHRPRLDWTLAESRSDIGTVPGAMFQALAHLARVRASLPQLHASARVRVLEDTDDGILAVARTHPAGPFVGLYNVTDDWRPFPLHVLREEGIGRPVNALSGHDVTAGADGVVWLSPYAAWWVVDGA